MTPGELDWARRELEAASRSLEGAHLLVTGGERLGAASRLYYAAFHAARAALSVRSDHAKTHSGQITLFERAYGKTPLLGRLLGLRVTADYGPYEDFAVSIEDLERLSEEVGSFVDRCHEIVKDRERRGPDEADPPPDL